MYSGAITDVPGIEVGHATHAQARTGVTAVIARGGAIGGVDVRGGAPGTRETDALRPGHLVERANGVLLCGGSAYGLDAATGAMRYFERRDEGFRTAEGVVPIVAAAVIYDLGVGESHVRPDADMGALACIAARKACAQGRVGAGAGATVSKLLPGGRCADGGVGTASIVLPGGCVIGVVVVVNAAGDVRDPHSGEWLACACMPGMDAGAGSAAGDTPGMNEGAGSAAGGTPGTFRAATDVLFPREGAPSTLSLDPAPSNTTIGVVATDARLTVAQTNRLASMAHDGFARAIVPVHLPVDGDTVFALSTGDAECEFNLLCAAAAEVMARAVANAVLCREGDA